MRLATCLTRSTTANHCHWAAVGAGQAYAEVFANMAPSTQSHLLRTRCLPTGGMFTSYTPITGSTCPLRAPPPTTLPRSSHLPHSHGTLSLPPPPAWFSCLCTPAHRDCTSFPLTSCCHPHHTHAFPHSLPPTCCLTALTASPHHTSSAFACTHTSCLRTLCLFSPLCLFTHCILTLHCLCTAFSLHRSCRGISHFSFALCKCLTGSSWDHRWNTRCWVCAI